MKVEIIVAGVAREVWSPHFARISMLDNDFCSVQPLLIRQENLSRYVNCQTQRWQN